MQTDVRFERTLHQLADASAAAILPHFRVGTAIENKAESHFDPITAADKAAEQVIRNIINDEFPGHGIIGEEFGAERTGANVQWIIDPIDGTRAFVQGLPTWGTLVGVTVDGQPTAGIMNQPHTRERFWSDGEASYFRGIDGVVAKIKTRETQLSSVQMATTDPYLFTESHEQACFQRLLAAVRTCRYGTDCYAYCMLAAGHIDVVLESGLQPYDIVALIPIIEDAGGRVTTWEGESAVQGGQILACGDRRLHDEILDLLKRNHA